MRLLPNWQYKTIEHFLFNYKRYQGSELETDRKMVAAINEALYYFRGTIHETMMREYYFNRDEATKKYTSSGHYKHVCLDILHTEESNGYVIRREIVYKVAMICYELHVFRSGVDYIG